MNRLTIAGKLYLLVAGVLLMFLALGGWVILDQRNKLMAEKETATRHVVEVGYGILDHYDQLSKKGGMSVEQAKSQALESIKSLRYGKGEYLWINDMYPRMVMHPVKPELDGKDLSSIQDKGGKKLFVEFVNVVKKDGEGFVEYYWPKPGEAEPVQKISYVKGFKNWNWLVGSGIYVDDVDAQLWRDSKTLMVCLPMIAMLLLALAIQLHKGIAREINTLRTTVRRIASGDFPEKVDEDIGADFVQMRDDLTGLIDTIKGLILAGLHIRRQHQAGAIDEVIPSTQFPGIYGEMAESINALVQEHIAVKMHVVDIVSRYAKGDFSVSMERLPGKKAQISEAVDKVRDGLRAAADQLLETTRIKSALDYASTNVMIADADRKIIFMNKSVTAMLSNAQSDIRKALPQFDVAKVLGGSMDGFHRNPSHQANLLATLSSTYRAQIVLGGRTFALVANPIFTDKGERLGTVVEWADRTNEVAVEKEVSEIVAGAARGDFNRRIDMHGKEGFFHLLGSSINQLLDTSASGLAEIRRMLNALANGNLNERIESNFEGLFGELIDAANATSDNLRQIVVQIAESVDTIATASGEIAAGNQNLSSRTEQQAASLEETASSMEELTSTVRQNAENARQANQLAIGASDVAVKGGSVVSQVVSTMSAISDSAKKVVDIISVIDGIAFQTNILALNAAVEAARAGEQGRGFAVVASEVRNLAQRSATAAKEIKGLISESVENVDSGSKLVDEAGRTMQEIVSAVKRVTDLMSEISAASSEQSQGIDQVNQTITGLDEMTQQNAALVEEAAAAAESLQEQADSLSQAVSAFQFDQGRNGGRAVPARLAAPIVRSTKVAVGRGATTERSLAKPVSDDEWEEF